MKQVSEVYKVTGDSASIILKDEDNQEYMIKSSNIIAYIKDSNVFFTAQSSAVDEFADVKTGNKSMICTLTVRNMGHYFSIYAYRNSKVKETLDLKDDIIVIKKPLCINLHVSGILMCRLREELKLGTTNMAPMKVVNDIMVKDPDIKIIYTSKKSNKTKFIEEPGANDPYREFL